jgi:hypothetical protein
MENVFPGMGNDLPGVGSHFPDMGSDLPDMGNDFPGTGNDFPSMGNDFPDMKNDLPEVVICPAEARSAAPVFEEILPDLSRKVPFGGTVIKVFFGASNRVRHAILRSFHSEPFVAER